MKNPVEHGNPQDVADGFRRSLGEFATGVTVITTNVDGVNYGMTSNSFASVSLEPPLVLWSVKRESQSFPAFQACTHFAVNVLADDQVDISQRFAKSGPDKFDGISWTAGSGAAPLLNDVTASFECELAQVYDGGDHLILMGQVRNFCRYDREPLLFAKGRYAVAADHPDTPVISEPGESAQPAGIDEQLLSLLMIRAYSAIAGQNEQGRKSAGLGLTIMQARLLKAAHSHPRRTLKELQPELFLDLKSSEEILESVVGLKLLTVDGESKIQLTPEGLDRISSIIEHAHANEELLFRGISEDDLKTTQRVLTQIISEQSQA